MLDNQRKEYPISEDHIAYFTMEVGISHTIPTYSGGLGILAGDTLKSFADLSLPVVGVTLLNEKGYFYQRIDGDGNQIEDPVKWSVCDFMVPLPNEVIVNIEDRKVKVRAWKHIIKGLDGYNNPVIFLDTNCEGNSDYDRKLTSHLYGGDRYYRLCQEIVLGIGGVRMLESLGFTHIKKYHMNEGHAALLTVELLRHASQHGDNHYQNTIENVKKRCVFTTHTPVEAGHDRFDLDLFKKTLGDYVPEFLYEKIAHDNKVNMTLLALNMSHYVNGVAKRHGEVTKEMFPGYQIDSITNGVHAPTWVSSHTKKLFDSNIPGWEVDPFTLRYALSIPKEEIWAAHYESKRDLITHINNVTNVGFHIDRFTIGYARRFTAYKRPDMIISDLERLKKIAEKVGDIQVVFAGKAHAHDIQGKEILKRVIHTINHVNSLNGKLRMVFVPQYDMRLAKMLVSGCDVWLNTPQRPHEASGTSGMKAAVNGVPHFSTIDGWWMEGRIETETGWSIGPHPHNPDFNSSDYQKDAHDLYEKLENLIVPTFYGNHKKWMEIMRASIAMNASFFNTHRMAHQYIANAYRD
ncbi:MAG: alpha-glucan family phosphorylase [Candidatus Woesearchaeota archaeon]